MARKPQISELPNTPIGNPKKGAAKTKNGRLENEVISDWLTRTLEFLVVLLSMAPVQEEVINEVLGL